MHKTIGDRFHQFEAGAGKHLRRYLKAEEGAQEALLGVRQEARRFFAKVFRGRATPGHKEAARYTKHGVERYNAGNYPDAAECFERAVAMDPNYARAHYYLGNADYKRGRLTEAVTAWKRAIDAEPRSEIADAAREKLLVVGHGEQGVLDTLKDQMLHRR